MHRGAHFALVVERVDDDQRALFAHQHRLVVEQVGEHGAVLQPVLIREFDAVVVQCHRSQRGAAAADRGQQVFQQHAGELAWLRVPRRPGAEAGLRQHLEGCQVEVDRLGAAALLHVASDRENHLGRRDVEIANGLKSLDVKIDYILSSPLLRAKQTAEIVAKSIKYKSKIEEIDSLKPEGSRLEFYSVLSKFKQDSMVLVVGHEPYLSEMMGEAISQSGCQIDLKKAGLARIRVLKTLPKIRGELRWLLTPKQLKKMA